MRPRSRSRRHLEICPWAPKLGIVSPTTMRTFSEPSTGSATRILRRPLSLRGTQPLVDRRSHRNRRRRRHGLDPRHRHNHRRARLRLRRPVHAGRAQRVLRHRAPTRADVERAEDYWEEMERGQARYAVVYDDGGAPSEIYFAGYSYDLTTGDGPLLRSPRSKRGLSPSPQSHASAAEVQHEARLKPGFGTQRRFGRAWLLSFAGRSRPNRQARRPGSPPQSASAPTDCASCGPRIAAGFATDRSTPALWSPCATLPAA